jgi:ubiquinone/menaquinone biosynthesis C-methylase UbiE
MITDAIASICYPSRADASFQESIEDITTFIESRTLPYPTQLEDDFASRALKLGVESGMVLDVGTRVGLTALKLLWQNENFYSIGIDSSGPMIEHARATALAWELGERAVFQVGDARKMRFKTAYFDVVISDSTLHRFDDAVAVVREIQRVLKPKGALLIRDFRRPNRIRMSKHIREHSARFGNAMHRQIEMAIRAAYTEAELMRIVHDAHLQGIQMVETDPNYIMIERRGETDPGSWIIAREQYR